MSTVGRASRFAMRSSTARPESRARGARHDGSLLRVLWVAKGGLDRLAPGVELPSERYWGFGLLRDEPGISVTAWPVSQPSGGRLRRAATRLPRGTFGYRVSPQLRSSLRVAAQVCDVVVSFHHAATLSLLSLRERGELSARLVCLGIGLADRLEAVPARERRRGAGLLARADLLMVMSPREIEFLSDSGLENLAFLPFGVDTSYWTPNDEPDGGYVFAAGSDAGRDFRTLIEAWPFPLRIMTRAPELLPASMPPHVSLVQGDTAELRRLYGGARCVAVPLEDRLQPSGQNTVLQAMAMAKPVALTRTRGFWSERLVDGDNCVLVEPGDVGGLHAALRGLQEDEGRARAIGERARETVTRHFGAARFRRALLEIIRGAAAT